MVYTLGTLLGEQLVAGDASGVVVLVLGRAQPEHREVYVRPVGREGLGEGLLVLEGLHPADCVLRGVALAGVRQQEEGDLISGLSRVIITSNS